MALRPKTICYTEHGQLNPADVQQTRHLLSAWCGNREQSPAVQGEGCRKTQDWDAPGSEQGQVSVGGKPPSISALLS